MPYPVRLFPRACVCAAIAFITPIASAQTAAPALPRGITQVASVEGVTEYHLENGLRVLLFPDPAKSTTTVNIVYLCGSRHEDYGETGMAHLIEHLMSFGSPKHPDAKAEQATRGATRNASTSYDRTNYYETFPASDENIEWAIDLEADRMRGAPMKEEIRASQMSVVRNEMERGENSPTQILSQRLRATAFLWHNYGKTVIGARSDVENVPIERLQAFYDRYYHPNNAVLTIAGKLDPASVLELVAAKFGAIPRSPKPIPPTYTAEPTQDGERMVTLRRVGDTQAVYLGYHTPAATHPDVAALRILMDVLTGQPNGRLFKSLVETKKATTIGGSASAMLETGYTTIAATLRLEQSIAEVRDMVVQTMDTLAVNLPTVEEVDRSRAKLLRQVELSLADSSTVSFALGEAVASSGDWRLVFLQRDWLRAAGLEDVARVAKTYFVPSNRTLALFIPEANPVRAEIPAAPSVASLVNDYKGDAAMVQGEAFDPSPENIEQRTLRGTLPGGLKFALLPKQTRGKIVRAEITLRFGDLESLRGKRFVSSTARNLLLRGTARRSRQQIADELTRLKARMFTSGTVSSVSITIESVRENLPELMKLAAEVLREPAFAPAEFDRLRQEQLAALESQRSDPADRAGLQWQRHFAPYAADDPRAISLPEEAIAQVNALTVDDVKAFWRDFAGASQGELVAVGDFDAAALQAQVSELLGNWKSQRPYARFGRDYQKVAVVSDKFETPDKANALFLAGMLLPVTDEHPDHPALVLAGYMLGGHSASRLYLRIRGKEGLSYGASASISAAPGDTAGVLTASAISNPQNSSKVEAAFRDEISRALKDGFEADEVTKAKNGWLESRRVARANDTSLLNALQSQARFGRTMQFGSDVEQKVKALTPEDITAALRRHVSLEQISVFRAGDFKKATGSE
jgi:zinc protease